MEGFTQDPSETDPRYEDGEPFTAQTASDGGQVEIESEYRIESANDAWYDEMIGEAEIDQVMAVFTEAGADGKAIYDNREFIPKDAAFSAEEIYSIESAVAESYSDPAEFIEDVRNSVVHPFQSKQIEVAFNSDVHIPTSFSDYDGFPDSFEKRTQNPIEDYQPEIVADGGKKGFPDYVGSERKKPDEVEEKETVMSDFPA